MKVIANSWVFAPANHQARLFFPPQCGSMEKPVCVEELFLLILRLFDVI
jgi:hypothetical protein